jgi:hypothetical protein
VYNVQYYMSRCFKIVLLGYLSVSRKVLYLKQVTAIEPVTNSKEA